MYVRKPNRCVCISINYASFLIIISFQQYSSFVSPSRLKNLANGKPVVLLPLILYTDDLSGNKSKQWKKFDCWCLKLAGLSKKENSKLHNIHFICCSNKTSVVELSEPVVEELKVLEEVGIEAYDAGLQTDVLLVAPVLCVICDNPRQSEIMNHLGSTAKRFCRMCMVRHIHSLAFSSTHSLTVIRLIMKMVVLSQTQGQKLKLKEQFKILTPGQRILKRIEHKPCME